MTEHQVRTRIEEILRASCSAHIAHQRICDLGLEQVKDFTVRVNYAKGMRRARFITYTFDGRPSEVQVDVSVAAPSLTLN